MTSDEQAELSRIARTQALGRWLLSCVDMMVQVAGHSGDEDLQAAVESICDDIKPFAKHAARYGSWRLT